MGQRKMRSIDDLRHEAEKVIDLLKERFPPEEDYRPYTLILEEARHLLIREAQLYNSQGEQK